MPTNASTHSQSSRELSHCFPLLVEDDACYAHILTEALKRCGVPVQNIHVVSDGERAASYLAARIPSATEEDRPALPTFVMLDLRLRRRSGFSVLEWMRSHAVLASLPVVILTGTARDGDLARSRELGADSFYVKPFHFAELIAMTTTIVTRWPALQEATPTPS